MSPAMPFGKHRGKPITSLPDDYLHWAVGIARQAWLREALGAELARRERINRERSRWGRDPFKDAETGVDEEADQLEREIIEAGRRALAKRHHPDHGGDTQKMQRINAVSDALLSRVRR